MNERLEHIKIKLKEIYLPYLLISIGTILLYSLFRFFLDIKFGVLPLKEDLLNFWLPFFLPWIPVTLWLRRRVFILRVKGKRDNGHFLYQFAMVLFMTFPMVVSQNYIEKAPFDLIEVATPSDVKNFQHEKYFKINSFQVDRNGQLPYSVSRTSGRNNTNLNFYLYFSCPFENDQDIWYGIKYNEQISNSKSSSDKELAYQSFITEAQQKYQKYNFQEVTYFEQLGFTDDRDSYRKAILRIFPDLIEEDQIILIPQKDSFENRLGETFAWIFKSFGIGAFILLIMVLIPKIDQKEYKRFKEKKPLKEDDLKDILEAFDVKGAYPITALFLILNLLVFIFMIISGLNIISPTSSELLEIGGNRRLEVMNGSYWRLLTSVFIHGGLFHLAMNLFGLGLSGQLLEPILGKLKLTSTFILCGILASLASIFWNENIVSVGASGAIFGWFGLISAFTVFRVYPPHMIGATRLLLGIYVGISLLLGFFSGGIDNAAHLGGLLSGFLIGVVLIQLQGEQLKENAKKM